MHAQYYFIKGYFPESYLNPRDTWGWQHMTTAKNSKYQWNYHALVAWSPFFEDPSAGENGTLSFSKKALNISMQASLSQVTGELFHLRIYLCNCDYFVLKICLKYFKSDVFDRTLNMALKYTVCYTCNNVSNM